MGLKRGLFLVVLMLIGVVLYSCGGGESSQSTTTTQSTPPPSITSTESAQALLGPLGNATVEVYRLLDNGTMEHVEGCDTVTSTGTTLDEIGYFNSCENKLNPNDWYVYKVSGGYDYDPYDNGSMANPPLPNHGTLCLVAKGGDIAATGELKVTPVSNMVCNVVLSQIKSNDNVSIEEAFQNAVNSVFDNSTQTPTVQDLLTFDPRYDRGKLKSKYKKAWLNLVKQIRDGSPITSPILYRRQLTNNEKYNSAIGIDNNTLYLYYTYDNDSTRDVMLRVEKMGYDSFTFDNYTIDLTQVFDDDNLTGNVNVNIKDGFIYNGFLYFSVHSVSTSTSTSEQCVAIYEVDLSKMFAKQVANTIYCADNNTDILSIAQANRSLYYLVFERDFSGSNYSYYLYKKSLSTPTVLRWDISELDKYGTTIKVSSNNTVYFMLDNGSLSYISGYDNVTSTLQPVSVVNNSNTPLDDVNNISMCDSNTKLLASTDNGLYLIDADNGKVIKKFADNQYVIASVCDNKNYYYISVDKSRRPYDIKLHIIDKRTYKDEKTVLKFFDHIRDMLILAKDGLLYVKTNKEFYVIDSYLLGKVKLFTSSNIKEKVFSNTNYMYLLAKSPDNSLLYAFVSNENGEYLRSFKAQSLDNGSLYISISSPRFYTLSNDGSLMFFIDGEFLYEINLENQNFIKFIMPENINKIKRMSYSQSSNGLYLLSSGLYYVKLKSASFDNGKTRVQLDNATKLDLSNISSDFSDISVSRDGKILSAISKDGKIYMFGINGSDNVTLLKSVDYDNESEVETYGEMFLRPPVDNGQIGNRGTFYFVYSYMDNNESQKVDACMITYDNSSSNKPKCYTYSEPLRSLFGFFPILGDLSGFVVPYDYSEINVGYLRLNVVTSNELENNANQKWFSLVSDCCDASYYTMYPMVLAGNTLYGTYCVHARSNLERVFVPNNDDVNYCKIFYVKSTE